MEINLVTAVSRPQNLPLIAENIKKSFKVINVVWHCIFDNRKVEVIPENCGWHKEASCVGDVSGGTQKNLALSTIEQGLIYFLDDDNFIHPDFEQALLDEIQANPDAAGFVFSQVFKDEKIRLIASDNGVRWGNIDCGQFVIDRQHVKTLKFPINVYSSDWSFFKIYDKQYHSKIIFANKKATYYNYLR